MTANNESDKEITQEGGKDHAELPSAEQPSLDTSLQETIQTPQQETHSMPTSQPEQPQNKTGNGSSINTDTANSPKKSGSVLTTLTLLVSLAALGGGGFLYYKSLPHPLAQADSSAVTQTASEEITTAHEANQIEDQADLSGSLPQENRAGLEEQGIKLSKMESTLLDHNTKIEQLTTLYQQMGQARFDWLMAEVEYNLNTATMQIQANNNIDAAIAILQTTQKRLASFNRPELMDIQNAIAKDITTLQQTPRLDMAAMSGKIDAMTQTITTLPTSIDTIANTPPKEPQVPAGNTLSGSAVSWWSQAWEDFKSGLGSLVEIRHTDGTDPVFLSPEQGYFTRENMKLQLGAARLALMQQQQAIYLNELDTVERNTRKYFDLNAPEVQKLLQDIAQLKAVKFNEHPEIVLDSIRALNNTQNLIKASAAATPPATNVLAIPAPPAAASAPVPSVPAQASQPHAVEPVPPAKGQQL